MVDGRRWVAGVAGTVLDLAVVCCIALGTYLAWLLPGDPLGPLRLPLGAAFVLLAPGYAVTAALFPRRESPGAETNGRLAPAYLSGLERLVYAVGLSIVTVPLLVLFLQFTAPGITLRTVVLTLTWFVLVTTGVAAVRRLRLPQAEQFRLPVRATLAEARTVGPPTAVIGALFVLSVAVAGTTLATADSGDAFTEFYLLAEDDGTGDLAADDYPSAIASNESAQLTVGIENREGRSAAYTVLAEFHRVEDGGVEARWRAARYGTELRAGGTNRTELGVSPPAAAAGERLRLTFLLYRGSVDGNPAIDGAYRTVHIWVDVPAPGGEP